MLIAVIMFVLTLLVECVENYILKDPLTTRFTSSALLHRAFEALMVGLVLSGLISTKVSAIPYADIKYHFQFVAFKLVVI